MKASRFDLKASRFDLKASRFDLKASRFDLKASRFDLKASRFDLEASRFDLKASRFDLEAARFVLKAARIASKANRVELKANRFFQFTICFLQKRFAFRLLPVGDKKAWNLGTPHANRLPLTLVVSMNAEHSNTNLFGALFFGGLLSYHLECDPRRLSR